MAITIELNNKIDVEVITQESVIINTDKIVVEKVYDEPQVNATAHLSFADGSGHTKMLVLWNATTTPTYNEIGQWTDADVKNRIYELLNINQ